jgi:hypothetical protein
MLAPQNRAANNTFIALQRTQIFTAHRSIKDRSRFHQSCSGPQKIRQFAVDINQFDCRKVRQSIASLARYVSIDG